MVACATLEYDTMWFAIQYVLFEYLPLCRLVPVFFFGSAIVATLVTFCMILLWHPMVSYMMTMVAETLLWHVVVCDMNS